MDDSWANSDHEPIPQPHSQHFLLTSIATWAGTSDKRYWLVPQACARVEASSKHKHEQEAYGWACCALHQSLALKIKNASSPMKKYTKF